jgi:5-(carboxyamino)imidazole ribonucleotide mutase
MHEATAPGALVGVIMGSKSDWQTLTHAAETLERLGVPFEVRVVSAHRTPDLLFEYAAAAEGRGLEVIIAGAGGAAHLPGMTAAKTTLPVLGGVKGAEGPGFLVLHRANARRRARGHSHHR